MKTSPRRFWIGSLTMSTEEDHLGLSGFLASPKRSHTILSELMIPPWSARRCGLILTPSSSTQSTCISRKKAVSSFALLLDDLVTSPSPDGLTLLLLAGIYLRRMTYGVDEAKSSFPELEVAAVWKSLSGFDLWFLWSLSSSNSSSIDSSTLNFLEHSSLEIQPSFRIRYFIDRDNRLPFNPTIRGDRAI